MLAGRQMGLNTGADVKVRHAGSSSLLRSRRNNDNVPLYYKVPLYYSIRRLHWCDMWWQQSRYFPYFFIHCSQTSWVQNSKETADNQFYLQNNISFQRIFFPLSKLTSLIWKFYILLTQYIRVQRRIFTINNNYFFMQETLFSARY